MLHAERTSERLDDRPTCPTVSLGPRRDQDRVNVSKRIKLALVMRDLPDLYAHLGGSEIFSRGKVQAALEVGAYGSYCPQTPQSWDVRI